MNFLQLCQRTRQESGVSGSGPVSVDNQKAILYKLIEWVRQADIDIQRLHTDWRFLWRLGEVSFTAGVKTYDLPSLGIQNCKRLDMIAIAGRELTQLTWEQFKFAQYHTMQHTGAMTFYTIRPDGKLVIYPVPATDHTADVEYNQKPTKMLKNTDESLIPVEYRDIIFYRALMYYGKEEGDDSIFYENERLYEAVLNQLVADYLPIIKGLG